MAELGWDQAASTTGEKKKARENHVAEGRAETQLRI